MFGINNQMDGVVIKVDRKDGERSRFGEGEIKFYSECVNLKVPVQPVSRESGRVLDM